MVKVNSNAVEIQDGAVLTELLEQLSHDTGTGTAVAVDRRVIPREEWTAHRLEAGADIVILKATQGG